MRGRHAAGSLPAISGCIVPDAGCAVALEGDDSDRSAPGQRSQSEPVTSRHPSLPGECDSVPHTPLPLTGRPPGTRACSPPCSAPWPSSALRGSKRPNWS